MEKWKRVGVFLDAVSGIGGKMCQFFVHCKKCGVEFNTDSTQLTDSIVVHPVLCDIVVLIVRC